MMRECDRVAVGYTDMRQFRDSLQRAPLPLRLLARSYPPFVYRLKHSDGTVLRVFPERYY